MHERKESNVYYNYCTNSNKSKPILIKSDEFDKRNKVISQSEVDDFDNDLFEQHFKQKLHLFTSDNSSHYDQLQKLNFSQVLYKKTNDFDNITGKSFNSKLCFEDKDAWLRLPFKTNLRNIYRNNKPLARFTDEIDVNAENFVMTKSKRTSKKPPESPSKLSIGAYLSTENEKNIIEMQLLSQRKKGSNGFKPSITLFTKDIELLKNAPYTPTKLDATMKSNNDSKFIPFMDLDRSMIGSSRPAFVNKLFKKYDYEELELPGKEVQNRTKEKAFNLAIIKDLYNKITNWIYG
jgi:hypothetical protein